MMATPTYNFRIDWDVAEPEYISNTGFEVDTAPWTVGGVNPPTITRSTTRAYQGDASMLTTWATATTAQLSLVGISLAGLTVGAQYTAQAFVWVPTGSPNVLLVIGGITLGTASTLKDTWQEITVTWTAGTSTDAMQLWPATDVTSGQQVWTDEVHAHSGDSVLEEDISDRVLARTEVDIRFGRDQARSLSPMAPGETAIEVDNSSRDYSPENSSSPLADHLGPGRPVAIRAVHSGTHYVMYRGFTDDFDLAPDIGSRSVKFTALDAIARLKEFSVSTELHDSLTTGAAIHRILDSIGWPPSERDIDTGASTLRYWWEEGTDAFTAVERVVSSEGLGAILYVGSDGEFVFRDRHHRLTRTASTTVQATFRDTGAEPKFSIPFDYDLGWRDIINAVDFKVIERSPAPEQSAIWSDSTAFSLGAGQSAGFVITADDPFTRLQLPTQGGTSSVTGSVDFVVQGSAITFAFSRTSGQSLIMIITSPLGGSGSTIRSMQLRAAKVTEDRTIKVTVEDATSIAQHGRRSFSGDTPHLNRNDAAAIADLIIGQRSRRAPIVQLRLVGSNDTRLTQQLSRDLSDRIRIIDAQTGLDGEFFVEQISHRISDGGLRLETVFGCEKIAGQSSNVFKFDVAGRGFNDGVFGRTGFDDPATVFIFDHATQGQFDVGLFGT